MVMTLGDSVVDLSTSALGTLSTDDFEDCVAMLGSMNDFSRAQWKTLADLALKVVLHIGWMLEK